MYSAKWMLAFCALPLFAQTGRGYVRAGGGCAMQYLDEPFRFSPAVSVRLNLTERFGLEPEFAASPGPRFTQWTLIPNVTVDLRDARRRTVPYLIGGIGYFHEVDKAIDYKRSEMAWNVGIGARVHLGRRLFVAPEFRIGHVTRAAAGIGYRF